MIQGSSGSLVQKNCYLHKNPNMIGCDTKCARVDNSRVVVFLGWYMQVMLGLVR